MADENFQSVAEGEGFEPPAPAQGAAVFKTAAFDRSAIPPHFNLADLPSRKQRLKGSGKVLLAPVLGYCCRASGSSARWMWSGCGIALIQASRALDWGPQNQ